MLNIGKKTSQKGNYTTKRMMLTDLANMTTQDIKNDAALITYKSDPNTAQGIFVKNQSIFSQALCTLPEVNVKEINDVVRYVNLLPNGQVIISYFGAEMPEEFIAALTKLAKTARSINGAIFSGYAALTPALGEEKHFSPGLTIPSGIANIRVTNTEVFFSEGKVVKKMMQSDFIAGQWNKAVKADTFETNVLFMDRVQNNVTNVITENKIVRGYNINSKKAVVIQDQNDKLKVLSIVQWPQSAVITTPLGTTEELAVRAA